MISNSSDDQSEATTKFAAEYLRYELIGGDARGMLIAAEQLVGSGCTLSDVASLAGLSRNSSVLEVRDEVERAAAQLGLPTRENARWEERFAVLAMSVFLHNAITPEDAARFVKCAFDGFRLPQSNGDFFRFAANASTLDEFPEQRDLIVAAMQEIALGVIRIEQN
jgi:citrate lyase beta subunit